jgi:hypothetical protein
MRVHNEILQNIRRDQLDKATQWKNLIGRKNYKFMDEKYEMKIMSKLIPLLHDYGIKMSQRPVTDEPGIQSYTGYDKDGERVSFRFYNRNSEKDKNREGKYDLLVKIYYRGKHETVGVVDLNSKDGVENAFSLITMTLENMGVNMGLDSDVKEETPQEDTSELDNLANFRKGLTEQELIEIEVE